MCAISLPDYISPFYGTHEKTRLGTLAFVFGLDLFSVLDQ